MKPDISEISEFQILISAAWQYYDIEPCPSMKYDVEIKGLCKVCPLACRPHPLVRDDVNENSFHKLCTLTVIKAGFVKIDQIDISDAADLRNVERLLNALGIPVPETKPVVESEPGLKQPPQAIKPSPPKLLYLGGWKNGGQQQLYIERRRTGWGVTTELEEAAKFKSVAAVLASFRTFDIYQDAADSKIYDGFLQIFEDGAAGLRQIPRLTRQASLFDNLAPIEKQIELLPRASIATVKYSIDEEKILKAGFLLVRYNRDKKSIQRTYDNYGQGWAPEIPFNTFAAAERTLKEMLQQDNIVEVALDGYAHHSCANKLARAGFEFYRAEYGNNYKIPGRIKARSKNWGTHAKFEKDDEMRAAWDELMNDPKALRG